MLHVPIQKIMETLFLVFGIPSGVSGSKFGLFRLNPVKSGFGEKQKIISQGTLLTK